VLPPWAWILSGLAVLPIFDLLIPGGFHLYEAFRPILVFAVLGLGIQIVTGFTGLLHLGVAAFMAIGAYAFAILTCELYPFQVGFWFGLFLTAVVGGISGLALGIPVLRLRGDYLAIVTLGFGEIVQDCLKNLEVITKGTQGINPIPSPTWFGYTFVTEDALPWYYLFLGILTLLVFLVHNIEWSRIGREFLALRDDEIASSCLGIRTVRTKLLSFTLGASICSLAGGLWATYLGSSGEPGNYDFQISVIALCIIIVGGLGSLTGVLVGSILMVGFNSIVLTKLSESLARNGMVDTTVVWLSPNNWKYFIFGIALILIMRYRPHGLLPRRLRDSI
jgi:branched-chain amino acid transport system permease protein